MLFSFLFVVLQVLQVPEVVAEPNLKMLVHAVDDDDTAVRQDTASSCRRAMANQPTRTDHDHGNG